MVSREQVGSWAGNAGRKHSTGDQLSAVVLLPGWGSDSHVSLWDPWGQHTLISYLLLLL